MSPDVLSFVSLVLGVLGVGVGVAATYRAARNDSRPAYSSHSRRIIGPLPSGSRFGSTNDEHLAIVLGGRRVASVAKVYVAFWNSGRRTLDNSNILPESPFVVCLPAGSIVLGEPTVVSTTREGFGSLPSPTRTSRTECVSTFDSSIRVTGAWSSCLWATRQMRVVVQGDAKESKPVRNRGELTLQEQRAFLTVLADWLAPALVFAGMFSALLSGSFSVSGSLWRFRASTL